MTTLRSTPDAETAFHVMLTRLLTPPGIANLPNQRHKIVAKRGAAFTIMVRRKGIGARDTLS